ncbi:MAG: FAD-binding oxidoreductase [Nitrolancea sp.]
MIVSQATRVDVIDPILVDAFERRLLGSLVRTTDADYDDSRAVVNLRFDGRPELIVKAADAADVIRSVEFAREHGLRLAVRSGGHGGHGYSSFDGSLVVNLSGMKSVSVEPEKRTAWVQAGATTADLLEAAGPHGLAVSTGDTSSVGLGGLVTGGGIGWLVRKYGLTIDSLLSVEMVTADGRLVVASETQNPDLFWAVRGGGGNFGVVTAFEFQLQPVGMIFGGAVVLPPTPNVMRGFAEYGVQATDELTMIAMLMPTPPLPVVPVEAHGKLAFIVMVCYTGNPEDGQRAIEPLRQLATPLAEMVGPMPYSALYNLTQEGSHPHPAVVRSGFMNGLPNEAIEAILGHYRNSTGPVGMTQFRPLGGAFSRISNDATAFAHRDKSMFLTLINVGFGDETEQWVADLWRQLSPMTTGAYVNFLEVEGEDRIREAYPSETYARLAEVKRRYDPENVFNLNQNIKPA